MTSERNATRDVLTEPDAAASAAPEPQRGRVYLAVRTPTESRVVDLAEGDEITLGRADSSGVVVDDTRASRHHARIRRTARGVEVTDLGSRNGTRVNQRLLFGETAGVAGGDVVWVASTEVVVASAADPHCSGEAAVEGVVVADAAMVEVFAIARRLAQAPTTVLIVGETGAGKEVVAEYIHRASPRADAPLVRVNCASLPENLVESEFFGHEKGAFTGADRRKTGYIEAAQGGTLLLDEVGEIPASSQAKLLRVLETRKLVRVGATAEVPLDIRVLCATNRSLPDEVAAGRFRQDLYYRISAFTLEVPPLRERPLEVALLSRLFARKFAEQMRVGSAELTEPAEAALAGYSWPGNVRELRNAIEHAVIMARGAPIAAEHLPRAVRSAEAQAPRELRGQLEQMERKNIEAALGAHGGNQTRAAEHLGMSRRALVYKITKYGLRDRG